MRAWANIEKQYSEWELHIVGPDNDLNVERAVFPGPAYGSEKSRTYWSPDLPVFYVRNAVKKV